MMARCVAALLLVCAWVVPASASSGCAGTAAEEQWFICTLGGEPCGWMHIKVEENAMRRSHRTVTQISLRRKDSMVTSRLENTLVEALDGTVQEMVHAQTLGEEMLEERWFFLPERIRYIVRNGNRHRTSTKPVPSGSWYSMEQALRLALGTSPEVSATEPALSCRVLNPSRGDQPIATRFFRLGSAEITTDEGAIPTTHWRIEEEGNPPTEAWFDERGVLVRSRAEFTTGLGPLEMMRSTRAAATRATPAPEVMVATSVTPTKAAGAPRSIDRQDTIHLRVLNTDGTPAPLPSIGAQRTGGDGLVTIQRDTGSPEADGIQGDFLASVPMADSTDEAIMDFARRGAGHKVGSAARAESIRRAVNRHINLKNLNTAFATASETVRKKRGDCTEHAVLLVAALRAQDIPARAVNGLIWSRNASDDNQPAYVWHMWTQALIDGQWRDLDATLVGPRGHHCGHLAVSVNDLSRASINQASTQMLEILGDLRIEVLAEPGDQ